MAKNRGKIVNFEARFRSKSSLKYPLNVRKVCVKFPVIIRKESRHLESGNIRAMTRNKGT